MLLYQIKDVVREHFGRIGLPTAILDLALAEGRKLIEHEANFWWMEDEATFNLVVDQADYDIAASGGEITIPNFKDAQALFWRTTGTTHWDPVSLGENTKDDLDLLYGTADEGSPEAAYLQDKKLYIYPPKPQLTYDMKLYYWGYTTNPAGNNDTADELTNNWGMALIYAALIWGYEIYLKDLQGATYWRTLLGGPQFGKGGEIAKLKRENLKRGWRSRMVLVPHVGPGRLNAQRLNNLQLYPRR